MAAEGALHQFGNILLGGRGGTVITRLPLFFSVTKIVNDVLVIPLFSPLCVDSS